MSGFNDYKNIVLFGLKIFFNLDSVDPDEMPHYAAFYLGLHCLLKNLLRDFPYTKDQNLLRNKLKMPLFIHSILRISLNIQNGSFVYRYISYFSTDFDQICDIIVCVEIWTSIFKYI